MATWAALMEALRRNAGTATTVAAIWTAAGGSLMYLGIEEQTPSAAYIDNLWFNLGCISVLLGLGLGTLTIVSVARGRLADNRLRIALIGLVERGQAVLIHTRDLSALVPKDEYDAWTTDVESHLDDARVTRFRSWAGLPVGASQIPQNTDHARYEGRVITRLARLNEFLAELR